MSETAFESVGQEATFLGHVGGIERRMLGDRAETRLLIARHHLNPNGTTHGGVLMTLIDITLGMTIEAYLSNQSGRHPITVQLNTSMIAAATEGETVIGQAQVDGSSRTMSWASGRLVCNGRTLMTASAVFRNPPAPNPPA